MAMSFSASEMQTASQSVAPFFMRRSEAVEARSGLRDDADAAINSHRRSVASFASRSPLQRLAALLVAISDNNQYEGRDPQVVPDTLRSSFVAELLGIEVPALVGLLVALEHQRLVAPVPGAGLRLTDLAGLERLADAH
jgi:hypothetical protein